MGCGVDFDEGTVVSKRGLKVLQPLLAVLVLWALCKRVATTSSSVPPFFTDDCCDGEKMNSSDLVQSFTVPQECSLEHRDAAHQHID